MVASSMVLEEKEKMRRNIAALYSTLGRPAPSLPDDNIGKLGSPTVRPLSPATRPPATPAAAAAAVVAASTNTTSLALRTVDRTFHANASPPSPSPALDGSVIKLTGQLQETRGALEAEKIVAERANKQLSELVAKVAQMTSERDAAHRQAQRALSARKHAEDEVCAERAAKDDALHRLSTAQQALAEMRQKSEYSLAEARGERDAAIRVAKLHEDEALVAAQGSDDEVRALRAAACVGAGAGGGCRTAWAYSASLPAWSRPTTCAPWARWARTRRRG